mmetsp:Transcript_15394/g.45008  ORF Transcript_15394/g.45008 Transcript_15394/m.45008 type:complete len:247 (-) Transcript_15394:32-772(-)
MRIANVTATARAAGLSSVATGGGTAPRRRSGRRTRKGAEKSRSSPTDEGVGGMLGRLPRPPSVPLPVATASLEGVGAAAAATRDARRSRVAAMARRRRRARRKAFIFASVAFTPLQSTRWYSSRKACDALPWPARVTARRQAARSAAKRRRRARRSSMRIASFTARGTLPSAARAFAVSCVARPTSALSQRLTLADSHAASRARQARHHRCARRTAARKRWITMRADELMRRASLRKLRSTWALRR